MLNGLPPTFHESKLGEVPMRELGLTIAGTALEPILKDFEREIEDVGLIHVRPHFYLSTEWGVPWKTTSIAIPFYLVRPELAALHADRTGLVEGIDRADILRYLRHELGHVVNYAYELYERPDWVNSFGAITQPYVEEYRPQPWSTRFVRHLPGWYAQKHPDEDWAETFAVWMTPERAWRKEYGAWPEALAKLELCDALIQQVRGREPQVSERELDEDVADIDYSIERYYQQAEPVAREFPLGLDGALRTIFPSSYSQAADSLLPAADLIRMHRLSLARSVFTWTGHFPEDTRALLQHLQARAHALNLAYPRGADSEVMLDLTVLVTSLAMSCVHHGSYLP